MIDHQTYKDRRDKILAELEESSYQSGLQGGKDIDAIRKDNITYTQKAIDSLFIDVIGEDEKYVKIDPVKNVEVSIVNQVFSELRTIVKGK